MAKRNQKSPVVEVIEEPLVDHSVIQEDIKVRRTVVPLKYKELYAARAIAEGRITKAAKRSNGDWLAQELEAECMTGKSFDFDRFIAILEANGVKHDRWPSRTSGWQGRVRMSGAIVLRGVVRKAGVMVTPEGSYINAPEAFCAIG